MASWSLLSTLERALGVQEPLGPFLESSGNFSARKVIEKSGTLRSGGGGGGKTS